MNRSVLSEDVASGVQSLSRAENAKHIIYADFCPCLRKIDFHLKFTASVDYSSCFRQLLSFLNVLLYLNHLVPYLMQIYGQLVAQCQAGPFGVTEYFSWYFQTATASTLSNLQNYRLHVRNIFVGKA